MGGTGRVIRVMLVEDHAAFRAALAFLLEREPDMEVVAQAGSLAEAREALWGGALEGDLDVAVVDIGLPDGDGRELIGELRRREPEVSGREPEVSVLVLSATVEAGRLEEVLRAGADAVLEKVEAPQAIAYEVRRLASG
jgi:DNA-binding NarL/FixJ family response regulator